MSYAHNDYASEFKRRAGPLWDAAVAYAAGRGEPPKRPYQVELHLASDGAKHSCLLRCVDCHGQFLRRAGGAPRGVWLSLLEQLRNMGVPSVVYSGAYSDPTMDEELLAEMLLWGGKEWGVKLHCYGLSLSSLVAESISTAAVQGLPQESYVTVSKTAVDPDVYDRLCRPYNMTAEHALRLEEEGLRRLFDAMERTGWTARVSLNCRLTQINAERQHLADLLRWFSGTPEQVRLRFTTDYRPTRATDEYLRRFGAEVYISPEEAGYRLWRAMGDSGCSHKRLGFRVTDPSPRYEGDRCLNALLLSAVATDGSVFPCQSIASPANAEMSYGSVLRRSYEEIWADYVLTWPARSKPPDCPSCTASCEAQLNRSLKVESDARVPL